MPSSAVKYIAWVDAAGGTGRDSAQRVGVHRVPRDVEPLDQYLARKYPVEEEASS